MREAGTSAGDVREKEGDDVGPLPERAEPSLDVRRADGAAADAGLMRSVLDALPSPTVLLDPDGTIVMGNSAWTAADEEYGGHIAVGADYYASALRLCDDDAARYLVHSLRELARGDRAQVSVDRSLSSPAGAGTLWFHVQGSRVDRSGHVVVTHTDVTARVQAERTSAWQARHDHLTELPNRAHLHELIDAELQRADRPSVAVLFLDVDGFKDVNDSLGHDVGDELLRQLASRLLAGTRAQDTVGRLGGDEFVVLCRDCDTDGAEHLAARCQAALEKPFDLGGRAVRLSASIGIAAVGRTDDHSSRSTDLVRDADLAMYAAKAAGRNRVRVFSPDLRSAVQQRMQLAAELRDAIESDQLVLHYQPVIHLPTGLVDGAEALVRWRHPERGLVPPCEFIPLAEQYELIGPLTRWVLATATRQAAAWHSSGLSLLVGVNVSAVTIAGGTLLSDVAAALAESGLPADRLVIELTETTVADDPERAAEQFASLRVSGVEVAIDDFGSGYSSLGQLVNIPAGVLKIDRSLVAGSPDRRSQSAAAIAAVVALARACGMRSLAEGVETAEQLALAQELGCTYAQGFFIARPMPAEDVPAWVGARSDGLRAPSARR
ncbi:bifunctional diguanylate cyclase/phosphodiesterase [Blastococcus sp. CT_GayMR20]|uniref:putative bifunctional diguanylate cyclase/phosphodiesterase n=1 Tax=Blastococcus sp. CT_GayMR20 TaxID=2559609 RepID=UPI00107348F2|nr:bifunctional diguanylate cyclase/phosphodiesterase [Blastococcus sp. CT_GayMR20]TFV92814.1 bifunctional diguanylate cyclase/phosphodiesterase [Blastococcus sp. CT_GayMR20]TFV92849.1 bifunctional diguanylate cyclase/phosphodiesterase [Blastococcus sp. CT_GayMR20]